jgi:divalent metal cation (Fe/Co/Zn/Cd) transporter
LHRHKRVDTISKIIIGVGLAIMIGTAGASDMNTISYAQIVTQSLIGVCVMGIGVVLYKRSDVK